MMRNKGWMPVMGLAVGLVFAGSARAGGGAYLDALRASEWQTLQGFYGLYVTGPMGRIQEMDTALERLRKNTQGLRGLSKKARCKPDCAALKAAEEQLGTAQEAMREARRIVKGNLNILLRNQEVATKGNAAYMDAEAIHERRKLGFDLSMIVAKTFEFDFGPLAAQLARNLGAEDGSVSAIEKGGSFGSSTLKHVTGDYGAKQSLMKGNVSRSAVTALSKQMADELLAGMGVDTASEKYATLAASFTSHFADKVWDALNEAAASGEYVTQANLAAAAVESVLKAYADTVGKELDSAVKEARRDAARSESMRLLAIAEYKAMAALDHRLYHRSGPFPAKGAAVDLNWERGRFAVALGEACGRKTEPPRLSRVKAGDQREVVTPEPSLARAVRALRRANELLEKQLECAVTVVAGRVLTESGESLAGARVEMTLAGEAFTAISDASGSYEIRIPAGVELPGMVEVKARKAGYETGSKFTSRNHLASIDILLKAESSTPLGDCVFAGEWETDFGHMSFRQHGSSVKGNYDWDSGRITAEQKGKVLIGVWAEAPSYEVDSMDGGDLRFTLSKDCNSFTGVWRYGRHGDWAGTWNGWRPRHKKTVAPTKKPSSASSAKAKKVPSATSESASRTSSPPVERPPLREVWRAYALDVERSPNRGLPSVDVVETRFLVGDGRAVLERVRYPASSAKGPAVDAVLWGVNWRAGRTLERKQAEGEAAVERLKARAEKLRDVGFSLESLPARMAAAYGGKARPLKENWMPPPERSRRGHR